jgi:hypothetical protein
MSNKITTIRYTYGPEWGKEVEGMKMTLVHNPIFDGPIENYENNPDYVVEEKEI